MQVLNLPTYSFRIKSEKGKEYIFDDLRKKFVRLSPEEWVRQNFIRFLIEEKQFRPALMAPEAGVMVNGNALRADLIVYGRHGQPVVAVEFKAPTVKITQETFNQIVRYNMELKVDYLIVSNGLAHYCCLIDYLNNSYAFIENIPGFDEVFR